MFIKKVEGYDKWIKDVFLGYRNTCKKCCAKCRTTDKWKCENACRTIKEIGCNKCHHNKCAEKELWED